MQLSAGRFHPVSRGVLQFDQTTRGVLGIDVNKRFTIFHCTVFVFRNKISEVLLRIFSFEQLFPKYLQH
jgi:hypothetical protein